MPNLPPVGRFIQRYKQVQALLHASSRGVSMDWIVKQCGTSLLTPRVQIPSIHSREWPDFENSVVHSNWDLQWSSRGMQEKCFITADFSELQQQVFLQMTDTTKFKISFLSFLFCEHRLNHLPLVELSVFWVGLRMKH